MANSDNGIAVGDELVASIAREYGWKFAAPQRDAGNVLLLIANAAGTPAALERYSELKKTTSDPKELNEGTLNRLGYTLLQSDKTDDAILVFLRNVKEYPQSSNV